MYAARNVRYALNNQLVFIRSQRQDGRYPHRVDPCAGKKNVHPADPVCATLHPAWSTYLQGLFMASPAADVAWFMKLQPGNQADKYLAELKASLEAYDGYLVSMLPAACCLVLPSDPYPCTWDVERRGEFSPLVLPSGCLSTLADVVSSLQWSTRNDSTCFALHSGAEKADNCPATPSPGAANAHGLLWSNGTGDTGEDGTTKFCRTLTKGKWTDCDGVTTQRPLDLT